MSSQSLEILRREKCSQTTKGGLRLGHRLGIEVLGHWRIRPWKLASKASATEWEGSKLFTASFVSEITVPYTIGCIINLQCIREVHNAVDAISHRWVNIKHNGVVRGSQVEVLILRMVRKNVISILGPNWISLIIHLRYIEAFKEPEYIIFYRKILYSRVWAASYRVVFKIEILAVNFFIPLESVVVGVLCPHAIVVEVPWEFSYSFVGRASISF